jgi:hypothetical protein
MKLSPFSIRGVSLRACRCATAALGLALLSGCLVAPGPESITASMVAPRSVVLFFVDGLSITTLQRMDRQGRVPHIRRVFLEGGVGATNAVCSLPSITYPNAVSLITGRFPGGHGILGNQWFDRNEARLPGYIHADSYRSVNNHFTSRTVYDLLDEEFTVNVQCHTRRGVDVTIDNWPKTGADWLLHRFSRTDFRVGRTVQDVIRLAERRKAWPVLQTYYFPGVDEIGHRNGPEAEAYEAAIEVADASIGRICDAVQRTAAGSSTYYVLMSDHGMVATPPTQTWDLRQWLDDHTDLKIHQGRLTSPWTWFRRWVLNRKDAVLVVGADRRAHLHLRGPQRWDQPAPRKRIVDLATQLAQQEAVEIALIRDGDNRVKVLESGSSGVVERRRQDGRWEYGWSPGPTHPLQWATSQEWLQRSAASERPDFVPQVSHLMDSPRSGDVVLMASRDHSFAEAWPGGHGSCLSVDMRIPFFVSGPDLAPRGRIASARLVDIMPTILDFLGVGHRLQGLEIDGRSLVQDLRQAVDRSPPGHRVP